jgi:nucleotide-binding universal stress UspA family protein
MYKVIVAGTDGSPTATVAFRKAIELAKLTGATLHVVHAHQLAAAHQAAAGIGSVDVGSVNQTIKGDSARVCSDAIAMAARDDVEVVPHSTSGDPADALVAVAEDVDADLIVVGNRGMQGARRFVLGSVPNKVSHHSPCSLLIVDTARG